MITVLFPGRCIAIYPIEISPKFVTLWRIRVLCAAVILAFLIGFLSALIWIGLLVLLGLIMIGLPFLLYIFIPKLQKSIICNHEKNSIHIKQGVINVNNKTISIIKLQLIERQQTLVEKRLGVVTLVFHLAGEKTILSGLLPDTADALIDLCRSRMLQ